MTEEGSPLRSPGVLAELDALASAWSGREGELRAACDAGVREVVSSPVGYGRLDVEPLLRARLWIPDPREVEVEGGAWMERALLDEAGDLLCAEIFDGNGALAHTAYVVPSTVGRALVTFDTGYLQATRLELSSQGKLDAVAEAVGGIVWSESYDRDDEGRVVSVRTTGPRLGPGPASGRDADQVLAVAYTPSGVVASIVASDDSVVYVASDRDGREIVATAAEYVVSKCRDWLEGLPFPVERVVLTVLDTTFPEPLIMAYSSGPEEPRDAPGWEAVTSDIAEAQQQVVLAGCRSFGDAAARHMQLLLEGPARPANVTATFTVEVQPRSALGR